MLALLVRVVGGARPEGRPGAVRLALCSVLWLLVSSTMEGAAPLPVTPDHGLTAGDLAGLAGLALAGWFGWLSQADGETAR